MTFSALRCQRERERELSKEQYAIEAAAEVAYCFELDSLSGTKVLKKATEELPELRTGGGFHFTFFLHMATLFLLAEHKQHTEKIDSFALFWNSLAFFEIRKNHIRIPKKTVKIAYAFQNLARFCKVQFILLAY